MKLGAQLYTLRDYTKTPEEFEKALDRVAQIGFEGVQLSAVGCLDQLEPSCVKAALDSRGLVCVATHRSWDSLSRMTAEEIKLHHGWGCGYAAVAVPPAGVHERGLAGYADWLVSAKALSLEMGVSGLTLGYHNHGMEFQRFENGVRPYDLLMEATWLPLELDTCWVHAGGETVVNIIRRLHGRLPVVHVKDRVVFGWEVLDGPVGEGNLDWAEILSAFRDAGTEWLLVEQDTCRRDAFDCLESSFRFLSGMLA